MLLRLSGDRTLRPYLCSLKFDTQPGALTGAKAEVTVIDFRPEIHLTADGIYLGMNELDLTGELLVVAGVRGNT
jgi:hypothetical protein